MAKRLSIRPTILLLAVGAMISADFVESTEAHAASQTSQAKQRMSDEALAELVSGPMKIMRQYGLAQGDVALRGLIAGVQREQGPDSLAVADLIEGFGVQLYIESLDLESAQFANAPPAIWKRQSALMLGRSDQSIQKWR